MYQFFTVNGYVILHLGTTRNILPIVKLALSDMTTVDVPISPFLCARPITADKDKVTEIEQPQEEDPSSALTNAEVASPAGGSSDDVEAKISKFRHVNERVVK